MGIFIVGNNMSVNKKDRLGKRQSFEWPRTSAGYRRQGGDLVQKGKVDEKPLMRTGGCSYAFSIFKKFKVCSKKFFIYKAQKSKSV